MESKIENLTRKVDAIYNLLSSGGLSGAFSHGISTDHGRTAELEQAVRKAIAELEMTKSSFKSKQIKRIKEGLERAVEKKD